jgi:molecular chaperone Hsp33
MKKAMDNEKLIEEIKKQDRAVTAITKDGNFRVAAIRNTHTCQNAQKRHELKSIPAIYMAKHLTAASLMAAFLKGEERIIIETESSGLIARIYSEALQVGEIRGYIESDDKKISEMPINNSDILGDGFLKVQKILYNRSEPFTGIVELVNKDIAADLAHYYNKSEQIPTEVLIDAIIDESGHIAHSGGLIIQQMPGANDSETKELFNTIKNAKPLTEYFRENETPDKIIKDIIPLEIDILKSVRLDFFCRCSKESFKQKLILLPSNEIHEMQASGHNELVCRYCNERYLLDDTDFNAIIQEIESKKN